MKKFVPLAFDMMTSIPVFLFSAWMAVTDPFPNEEIFWGLIALCAFFVILPSVFVLTGRTLSRTTKIFLRIFYALMLLAGLFVLLYDSTYGSWREITVIGICLASIMKSFFSLEKIQIFVWFVLFINISVTVQAGDLLPPEKWPTTLPDVVQSIVSGMTESDKEKIRKTKKEDLIMFHHGAGTEIRNYYGLWRGNKKLIVSACGKPCHPDDASMIIIESVWAALQR